MKPDPVLMLALPGASSVPSAYGRGSPDHMEIVAAIDDAIALVTGSEAISWDGPDHPSLSWDLELENWVQVGIHEFASVLQFSIDVLAPVETCLSRSVLTVRDERLPRGWLRTRTPGGTRDLVLRLLGEWRTICVDGLVVDTGRDRGPDLPDGMRTAVDRAISRFGALAVANGMSEALDAGGIELMWHLRHASAHTRATLCASASGLDEATFDERTMSTLLEGLPEATIVTRDGRSPLAITVAPFVWKVGTLEETDPVAVLRELKDLGIDWIPETIVKYVKDENA